MLCLFLFASRRRHTIFDGDWSSDVCSSDLLVQRGLVDRIISAPHEMQILLMLGVALVLENVALVAFGPEPTRVRSPLAAAAVRSEERRVGKEGRSRWSPYH